MFALFRRTITLFLRNRASVFFSLINALIGFVLYVLFLKSNMADGWTGAGPQQLNDATVTNLLDLWLIGGILSVTGITTALTVLTQMVRDRENGTDIDFTLSVHSHWRITAGYLMASIVVCMVMQTVVFAVIGCYFTAVDGMTLPWRIPADDIQLALLIVLNSALSSLLCCAFYARVRTQAVASGITSVLGTAAGFVACVYFPMGILPKAAQHVVQLWPGAYASSLFRRALMTDAVNGAFSGTRFAPDAVNAFDRKMGLGYILPHTTTRTTAGQDILLLIGTTALIAAIAWFVQKVAHIVNHARKR